jgi:DNA ligase-associated metallophosphoesterase
MPAPRDDDPATVVVGLAGERIALLAERALHWARERTLFVADVHLGKAAAFRAGGIALPRGTTAADLARLSSLIERTKSTRLVVLGDLLHAAQGREALASTFAAWRARHPSLAIVLVRGNHDARAGDPPAAWRVDVVEAPHALAPFVACHEPPRAGAGYALCGHVHPGVCINGAHDAARLPCFVVGRERTLLPAFGRFTGLAIVAPCDGDRLIAVAGNRLFALPR